MSANPNEKGRNQQCVKSPLTIFGLSNPAWDSKPILFPAHKYDVGALSIFLKQRGIVVRWELC